MEFSAALKHLKNGQKIRRTSWSPAEEFVFEAKDQQWHGQEINPFMLIKTKEIPAYSMFQPNSCEVLADDWELVE